MKLRVRLACAVIHNSYKDQVRIEISGLLGIAPATCLESRGVSLVIFCLQPYFIILLINFHCFAKEFLPGAGRTIVFNKE